MQPYQTDFIELARRHEVLKFGEFTLKSGRVSPYFFNAGAFCTGAALAELGRCYASRMVESGLQFDVLLGPAYKGIPLATTTAVALADQHGMDIPIAYNRKEAKSHGEGGVLVGAPLQALSAIQELEQVHGAPVLSIIDMDHIISYLEAGGADMQPSLEAMKQYRRKYGV